MRPPASFLLCLTPLLLPSSTQAFFLSAARPSPSPSTTTSHPLHRRSSSSTTHTTTHMMSSSPSTIYIVTGSTDGIGKHTATNLAALGPKKAKVFVHGRDQHRARATAYEMQNTENNEEVEAVVGDLGSLQAIRKIATEFTKKIEKMDPAGEIPLVLINNAGVFEHTRKTTGEAGFEQTFAINVAAPFFLTGLLLPLLQKRKNSRIVNISSISQGGSVPWDDLQLEKPGAYSDHRAYSLSKLLMAMLSMEQAERFGSADLPIVCCDPGTVNTKMLEAGWGAYGMRVEQANDETFLATDPSIKDKNGMYFVSKTPRKANSEAYDKEARKKLWTYLEEKTGLKY